ncbi:MAG: HAD-IC family P-type ATPase, partial [Patescibacteria group bacterium]|nr:HAD-IC family P-type ATPase [Patescibacteria group bacterium]
SLGKNVIERSDRTGRGKILASQFKNPLILMLVFASLVTAYLQDYEDTAFILIAVLVNVGLGFFQENKAEIALAKLGTYIKERTRVIRDGRDMEISAEEVVPGDIVKLSPGVRIPADARVLRTNGLLVDEAILTGESLAVEKGAREVSLDSDLGERSPMVWGGTLVVDGQGEVVVVATGLDTELGKIASLVKGKEKEETPLQKAIYKFALRMGVLLIVMSGLIFALGASLGFELLDMFLTSVAIAVAAVPEGLPIAMTVILAVGVERLARHKGVVKKLLAAEALGGTTLILTDKTGTLTQASMELSEIISDMPKELVLELALLLTDVIIGNPSGKPEDWHMSGRPMDTAIAKAAVEHKVLLTEVFKRNSIMEAKPFNSRDKYAGVHAKFENRSRWIYLGAPDVLLEMADIGQGDKQALLVKIDELAYAGSRVLGLLIDKKMTALLCFRDPVRQGVAKAIEEISNAGVKTKIVTGDHKGTAVAVAKELGFEIKEGSVMIGKEIEGYSDEALKQILPEIVIFARVSPKDKLRLVGLYRELGEVVAVTGDGVNDAPALKGADVGVAVGSGTDVAKGAADLIILDDNFETIVEAIREGRRILSNIKKVIVYLLSSILDELVLIGGALIAGVALPLNALLILWVNFFSDSFPAIGFAFERDGDYLDHNPRAKQKGLMDTRMKFLVWVIGTLTSGLLLFLYLFMLNIGLDPATVRTFIFASFSVYTLFLVFSVKSLHKNIFTYNPFSNLYLVGGVLIGFVLTALAIYWAPLRGILGTVSLSPAWLWGVLGVGIVNILAVELGKLLFIHSR